MLDRNQNSFVIFSSHNLLNAMSAMALTAIPFKVLLGSYKGEQEQSFMTGLEHLPAIESAGIIKGQESILILEAETPKGRPAYLRYVDGSAQDDVSLGYFIAVPQSEAIKADGWTFDPVSGEYFTTRQEESAAA